jgi:VWFA-related protein
MMGKRFSWSRGVAPVSIAACLALAVVQPTATADQQPTFTATVDLIAVDVQVVDGEGFPVTSLRPEDFEVSINGRKRRVASADFVQTTTVDGTAPARPVMSGPQATNLWPTSDVAGTGTGRTYVLAFDSDSFTVQESRDVVAAARGFIRRLQPGDAVGLYTFPVGPRMEPTLEHNLVSQAVDRVVGRSQSVPGEHNLSPSEIIDITSEVSRQSSINVGRGNAAITAGLNSGGGATSNSSAASMMDIGDGSTLRRVQLRECGSVSSACAEMIQTEAATRAFYLEGRATEGLNGLRALVGLLNEQPGRKTVVLFSAGIPVTDRPGGRPEVGDLAKLLGQDAAATNTSIYTLHVDNREMRAMSAESRRGGSTPVSRSRDMAVGGRLLEEFSGASGGALLRVLLGGGELALERVFRETSSHYLLGVEPDEADRDGKIRQLRVRVDTRGVTVRSRSWVVVPQRSPS